jgi:hypothetical protein
MGTYLPLFSIFVEHSFFTIGLCNVLVFRPSSSTVSLVKSVGLMLRYLPNGIRVFYDQDMKHVLKMFLEDNQNRLSLVFKVKSRDRYFQNYTDSTGNNHEHIAYLSNENHKKDQTGRVCLHKGEYVNGDLYIPMNSSLLEGVFDRSENVSPPLFVIRINVQSWLNGESDIANIGYEQQFFFRLRERKTFWKYYILGHSTSEELHITDLDRRVEFEALGEKLLPHNEWVKIFRSTTAIALSDRPMHRFQLHENTLGVGRVVVKRLPAASGEQICLEEVNGTNAIVSEIYVNC